MLLIQIRVRISWLGGATYPPVSLHVTRKPPTAPTSYELLRNQLHVPRPYIQREFEEVPARLGLVYEILCKRSHTFGRIAGRAGGHYVAARVIATFYSWLHVVYT